MSNSVSFTLSKGTNKIKDVFSISRFSNLLLTANKSETDLHWPGHSVFHEIVIDGQIRLCQYHRMQRRAARKVQQRTGPITKGLRLFFRHGETLRAATAALP